MHGADSRTGLDIFILARCTYLATRGGRCDWRASRKRSGGRQRCLTVSAPGAEELRGIKSSGPYSLSWQTMQLSWSENENDQRQVDPDF